MVQNEWQERPAGRSASNGYRVWTGLRGDDCDLPWCTDGSRQPATQARGIAERRDACRNLPLLHRVGIVYARSSL